jgi:hypothetical protein
MFAMTYRMYLLTPSPLRNNTFQYCTISDDFFPVHNQSQDMEIIYHIFDDHVPTSWISKPQFPTKNNAIN